MRLMVRTQNRQYVRLNLSRVDRVTVLTLPLDASMMRARLGRLRPRYSCGAGLLRVARLPARGAALFEQYICPAWPHCLPLLSGCREKECILTRKLLYGHGAFGAMFPTTNLVCPHNPHVSLTLTPKLIMDGPFQRTSSCRVSFN